jgi:hypothetical protein
VRPTKDPGKAWPRKNSLSQACCLAGNERRASSLMQKEGALIFEDIVIGRAHDNIYNYICTVQFLSHPKWNTLFFALKSF